MFYMVFSVGEWSQKIQSSIFNSNYVEISNVEGERYTAIYFNLYKKIKQSDGTIKEVFHKRIPFLCYLDENLELKDSILEDYIDRFEFKYKPFINGPINGGRDTVRSGKLLFQASYPGTFHNKLTDEEIEMYKQCRKDLYIRLGNVYKDILFYYKNKNMLCEMPDKKDDNIRKLIKNK